MNIITVHSFLLFSGLKCSSTAAVRGFIEHVTNRSETEILIIGSDCSVASQPVASLAPFWNLVQVRHALYYIHCVTPSWVNFYYIYASDVDSVMVYAYTVYIKMSLIYHSSSISPNSKSHLHNMYICTDITRVFISSIVQPSNVPHLPAYCSIPWQHCTRDSKVNAALRLEAYCYHYSRGGHIHSGMWLAMSNIACPTSLVIYVQYVACWRAPWVQVEHLHSSYLKYVGMYVCTYLHTYY